jgi:hypothetical protein
MGDGAIQQFGGGVANHVKDSVIIAAQARYILYGGNACFFVKGHRERSHS